MNTRPSDSSQDYDDGAFIYDRRLKPRRPLGIESHADWIEKRKQDLLAAVTRYDAAGEPIPDEWVHELASHYRLIK